ncbi:MAG: hypothetical protein K940chlam7_02116 [Chlamydiae bacterium]|nr:hypothetical protein [Chlamydiota bacterium]
MNALSNIHSVTAPSTISHSIPKATTKLEKDLTGTLYLSKSGYVYNGQSRSVLWIKFLGLGLSLPFRILITKVCNLFKRLFKKPINEKGSHDSIHMLDLSRTAWKGFFGWKMTLKERADQYSMKELDYNTKSRENEMEKVRSQRILSGFYTARCMHPLFHKDQVQPNLVEQLTQLEKKFNLYKKVYDYNSYREQGLWSYTKWANKNADPDFREMRKIEKKPLHELKTVMDKTLQELQNDPELQKINRLRGYCNISVINQNPCRRSKNKIMDTLFQEDKVGTDNADWYKNKRFCCIHKIDFCDSITCWAIDCMCCIICCVPANCHYCIL